MSLETKNFFAKFLTLIWFGVLVFISFWLVKYAIRFDINAFLWLTGSDMVPKSLVLEGKMILYIVSMSIFWWVSFAIRVFYTSVRYANIYDQAYSDYRGKNITFDQFQKLIRVEMYVERFNYTWFLSFVTQPFGSVFLGIICYFIARSGLWFVSGVGELTVQSVYMYGVLSFMTGFYSNKFVEWLDHLSDKIFSKDFIDQKTQYQQQILEVTSNDMWGLKNDITKWLPEDMEIGIKTQEKKVTMKKVK